MCVLYEISRDLTLKYACPLIFLGLIPEWRAHSLHHLFLILLTPPLELTRGSMRSIIIINNTAFHLVCHRTLFLASGDSMAQQQYLHLRRTIIILVFMSFLPQVRQIGTHMKQNIHWLAIFMGGEGSEYRISRLYFPRGTRVGGHLIIHLVALILETGLAAYGIGRGLRESGSNHCFKKTLM